MNISVVIQYGEVFFIKAIINTVYSWKIPALFTSISSFVTVLGVIIFIET